MHAAAPACRIGLNRTIAGAEYAWVDSTGVGQGVVSGEAWPHWAWLQPQLAVKPGHDCVAAWADYRYERFLGSDTNANQVSGEGQPAAVPEIYLQVVLYSLAYLDLSRVQMTPVEVRVQMQQTTTVDVNGQARLQFEVAINGVASVAIV
jgi:hypothetical protein